MKDNIKILNPSECEWYEDGDCIYEEDCGEYASKCVDVQIIGKCHFNEGEIKYG